VACATKKVERGVLVSEKLGGSINEIYKTTLQKIHQNLLGNMSVLEAAEAEAAAAAAGLQRGEGRLAAHQRAAPTDSCQEPTHDLGADVLPRYPR